MSKYIYILTNPTIPDLIKIGTTDNLDERLKQLSSHAGVAVPFECYYSCEVEDGNDIEKRLHFGLGDHRINPRREFFRISPERVKMLLEGWAIQETTPEVDIADSKEELDSLNRERARKPVFTFSMAEIPIGSEITFLTDDKFVATVADDRKIEFNGEITSINQATLEIFNNHLNKGRNSIRGTEWWVFDNETLNERRVRLEN